MSVSDAESLEVLIIR